MDRPKIDGIVDYIKAAYPDSWRDYVLCRARKGDWKVKAPFFHVKQLVHNIAETGRI